MSVGYVPDPAGQPRELEDAGPAAPYRLSEQLLSGGRLAHKQEGWAGLSPAITSDRVLPPCSVALLGLRHMALALPRLFPCT